MSKSITIEICERLGDWDPVTRIPRYHAQIKGLPGVWAAGRTANEAVGDLICCHPERFGIEIKDLGKKAR